uniref:Cytochrome c oxidase assembly protein COX11 n=1 Tax=Tetranychus urticae TaxID=32264 RepID=T1L383_TETUR
MQTFNPIIFKALQSRFYASTGWKVTKGKDVARYSAAAAIGFLGLTFASVPLYRIYCQTTGQAGQQGFVGSTVDQVEKMKIDKSRRLRVSFVADATNDLQWEFKPIQQSIEVSPGETTLAFFTAKNPLKEAIRYYFKLNLNNFSAYNDANIDSQNYEV